MIGLAGAFGFVILVLPATLVAPGRFSHITFQLGSVGLIFVGGAAAAIAVRWLQLRDDGAPRTAQDVALAYRTRFLLQVAVAQVPGFLAFMMSLFARPYPGVAVMLGVLFTAGLVAAVGPTERNIVRLEDEARRHNAHGSVRGALDELYSWRP